MSLLYEVTACPLGECARRQQEMEPCCGQSCDGCERVRVTAYSPPHGANFCAECWQRVCGSSTADNEESHE